MAKDVLRLRRTVIGCAVIGVFAFIAFILAYLALDDIAAGEPDLSGEWFTVQLAFFLFMLFMAATFWLLAETWTLIGRAKERIENE